MVRAFAFLGFWLLASVVWAASATIGVVYMTATGQIMLVISPDSDDQLTKQPWAGKNQSLLIVDRKSEITAAVKKATGLTPLDYLAAVVAADGTVEAVVVGDATFIHGTVAAFPGVVPGQKYDADRKMFVIPEKVILAGALDENGIPSSVDVIVPAEDFPEKSLEPTKAMTVEGLADAVAR